MVPGQTLSLSCPPSAMAQMDIRVVTTDYKHYTVLYIKAQKGNTNTMWLQLYGGCGRESLLLAPLGLP